MNEFIEKLIARLEEKKNKYQELADGSNFDGWAQEEKQYLVKEEMCEEIIEIVNQLAEEYNNDFCEWTYDEFEEKWQTDCEVLFALHDSDREITHYCPYCGKKIKIAPYQPKGE